MPLDRRGTVLLIVDLQEGLLPVIAGGERILAEAIALARAARALGVPMLVTTRDAARLGATHPALLAESPAGAAIDRMSFSSFGSRELVGRLRQWPARRQLLVCGTESHVCVVATVLGARRRGYDIVVARDAVGSIAEENRQRGLRRMARAGATLASTVAILAELAADPTPLEAQPGS